MEQLRVVDLAHTMGITAKELIFKLRSIGVSVASEEDTLDLSTVRSIITGETLQRRPREVIVRAEKAEKDTTTTTARDRMVKRRRRQVVKTDKEILEVRAPKETVDSTVEIDEDPAEATHVDDSGVEAAAEIVEADEAEVSSAEELETVEVTEVEAARIAGTEGTIHLYSPWWCGTKVTLAIGQEEDTQELPFEGTDAASK